MTHNKTAVTAVPLHELLANRWSPRAYDATHRLSDETVTALLEAARWAPSANNTQPWRFLVARRGDATFAALTDLLAGFNQAWAPTASALVLVAAETIDESGHPRPFALYDTGQAVAAMTLQAEAGGLSVHQMGGFDSARAGEVFELDESLTPAVVVAIGRHDPDVVLPEPLSQRESATRTRKPLDDLLIVGPAQDEAAA